MEVRSLVLSSVDANIVEGMRNNGKKRCLEEVTDVELQWDAHGIIGGKKQCSNAAV
jgi:hypothetical protein